MEGISNRSGTRLDALAAQPDRSGAARDSLNEQIRPERAKIALSREAFQFCGLAAGIGLGAVAVVVHNPRVLTELTERVEAVNKDLIQLPYVDASGRIEPASFAADSAIANIHNRYARSMVEILATDNIERRSGNAMEFQVQAEGSGLLVRRHDQTYVATADHVAAAGKIHVLRGFGTSEGRFDGLGAVVKRDSDADVALLELGPSANNSDPLANRAMLLREDAAIAVKGQAIMQLGFREHQLVMTIGRVEGAGPFYTFDDGSVLDEVRKNLSRDAELVKSSAAIQKGMSGGPGFDMDGNLLGLNAVGRSLSMLLEGRDVKFELDSYLSSTKALITMLDQVHAETAATNRSWVGRTLAFWRGRPK